MRNISEYIYEVLNPFLFCKVFDLLYNQIYKKFVRLSILDVRRRKVLFQETDDLIQDGIDAIIKDIKKYNKETVDYLEYIKLDIENFKKLFDKFKQSTYDSITLSDMRYLLGDMSRDLENAILELEK